MSFVKVTTIFLEYESEIFINPSQIVYLEPTDDNKNTYAYFTVGTTLVDDPILLKGDVESLIDLFTQKV